MFEHVSDEGDDVEASECCGVALVILDQPAAARGPCEGSFDDPAPGQQDEAARCLPQSDDVQRNPLGRSGICGSLSGVALIDIGECDVVASCVLDIGDETCDRGSIA